jgi:hypothetical protein
MENLRIPRIARGGSRNGLVLQLAGGTGFLVQDSNQDRSEVLGTLRAVLYT